MRPSQLSARHRWIIAIAVAGIAILRVGIGDEAAAKGSFVSTGAPVASAAPATRERPMAPEVVTFFQLAQDAANFGGEGSELPIIFADVEKAGRAALPMVPPDIRVLLQQDLQSLRDALQENDSIAAQKAAAAIAARRQQLK